MKKIVIYQVLPRLFGNSNLTNKVGGSIEENGCGKLNDFTKEALKNIKDLGVSHIWYTGVIEHAHSTDYTNFSIAKDFDDVVKGKAGSPYAIKDYYDIDPDLAVDVQNRLIEFEDLVNRTHETGLKAIIDFVPNHVARNYISDVKPEGIDDFGFNDDVNTSFSPTNNYYYLPGQEFVSPKFNQGNKSKWNEAPAKVTGNDCMVASPSENDWYETVKLNYGVNIFNGQSEYFEPIPDTWEKMKNILMYWAAKKVDGFRCDMAEMVPVRFWNWVIPKIKKEYPSVLFIAEVYNKGRYEEFINVGCFDLLYDKVGMYDTVKNVVQEHTGARSITQAWEDIAKIHHQILFFTENHDEQRIASDFYAGRPEKGWPATFVSATINSNPFMIYFGQELGEKGMEEEGFSGKDGRTSIFDYWGLNLYQKWINGGKYNNELLTNEQIALRENYKRLFHLIVEDSAIYSGLFYDLQWFNTNNAFYNVDRIYSFLRYSKDSVLLIVVNFSEENKVIKVRIPQEAFHMAGIKTDVYYKSNDLMNGDETITFPGQVALTGGVGVYVKSYSGSVFKLK